MQLTKTFETKMKAEPGERSVVANISTTAVDRDGDVILPSGLATEEFMANPVVLLAHDSGSLPIGKVIDLQKKRNSVQAKIQFSSRPPEHPRDEEWLPDTVLHLFREKVLNAFSVGFIIDDSRLPHRRDLDEFGEKVSRVISKWRLVELSVVPVPANQEALAVAVSKSWLARSWKNLKKNKPLVLDQPKKLVLDVLPLNISAA